MLIWEVGCGSRPCIQVPHHERVALAHRVSHVVAQLLPELQHLLVAQNAAGAGQQVQRLSVKWQMECLTQCIKLEIKDTMTTMLEAQS